MYVVMHHVWRNKKAWNIEALKKKQKAQRIHIFHLLKKEKKKSLEIKMQKTYGSIY